MANLSSNALLFMTHLLLALFFIDIFLTNSTTTSLNSEKNGFILPLLQSDYILNPSLYANLTSEERVVRLFQSSYDPSLIRLPLMTHKNGLLAEIQIGSGAGIQTYYLAVDLNSHLTWIQCVPCNPSFPQTKPMFDPPNSRAFITVNATDPLCKEPFFANGNKCAYNIQYPDGNQVSGFLSNYIFTFKVVMGTRTRLERLYFGCTHASYMNSFTGEPAGIMGLNRAQIAFPKQLANWARGRFSYCMFKSNSTNVGFLRFGNSIVVRTSLKSTPFKSGAHGEDLDLFLEGISLGNHRLQFPQGTFEHTYISSNTIASLLVEPAYEQVKHTLMLYFQSRGLQLVHVPEYPLFELCYTLPQNYIFVLPTMTWHLRGADLLIRILDLYVIDTQRSFFCLAIMSDPHMTVLGIYQQSNYRFIFDLNNNVFSFGKEDCEHDSHL